MKNKILTLGLVGLILGELFVAKNVEAYRGDLTVKGPYYLEERHEAMQKTFANNDSNAWKNLMNGRGRVTEVINKNNFSKFAQIHNLVNQI